MREIYLGTIVHPVFPHAQAPLFFLVGLLRRTREISSCWGSTQATVAIICGKLEKMSLGPRMHDL